MEVHLSSTELAVAAEITPARVARLVRLGILEPAGPATFTAATAARLRRMVRLRRDLGVNFIGAAIACDLLERLEDQERELTRLRPRERGLGESSTEEPWIRTA